MRKRRGKGLLNIPSCSSKLAPRFGPTYEQGERPLVLCAHWEV